MTAKCNKCGKELPEGWAFPCCPFCGAPLAAEAAGMSLGDANAFAGDVSISVNNTRIERQKGAEEVKAEALGQYRQLCKQALADGIVTNDERSMLEDARVRLGIAPDWGAASRHIPDAAAAEVFNSVSVWEYRVGQEGELDEFLWNNVAACQANYLIDEGKLRKAQELLYEAGDSLYAMQDGSTVRKGAYASLLVALAKLYIAAGREDVAREALAGASRVFASGVQCSPEVKALYDTLN